MSWARIAACRASCVVKSYAARWRASDSASVELDMVDSKAVVVEATAGTERWM